MFALDPHDLAGTIVGCGDGPASFNAEATRRGGHVVSCDPAYRFEKIQLEARIAETYDAIMEQTRANADAFVWTQGVNSVEERGALRMAAMRRFLDDYDAGKAEGRYVDAALPALPFPDAAFDLAVCSHFLFLYSELVGEDRHHAAIREMCRVAADVRIFPLLALDGRRSPFVDPCAQALRAAGWMVRRKRNDARAPPAATVMRERW